MSKKFQDACVHQAWVLQAQKMFDSRNNGISGLAKIYVYINIHICICIYFIYISLHILFIYIRILIFTFFACVIRACKCDVTYPSAMSLLL